jgi:NAD(P)H-dependent FMN reductase
MRVTAIMGSYRRGGVIDTAIDEILAAAKEAGADVGKISLIDQRIEFCNNCRTCTQVAGATRGECVIEDGMRSILDELDRSDAIVLGSPMNFGTVTALMKRFVERLVCFGYWPWGVGAPKVRNARKEKRAVVVASSAAPAIVARLRTPMVKLLREAAGLLGARTIGVLFIGLAAGEQRHQLGERARKKARHLGQELASNLGQ